MTPETIMIELSKQGAVPLPRKALLAAGEQRDEMTGIFLSYVNELAANNGHMPDERRHAFLIIFYLLAEWHETKAFRPLIDVLRIDPDNLDLLIGDGITTMAWRAIYSVFDGDFAPIILAIHDENTDEFIRSGMFQTLSAIAKHTPGHRPEIISILKNFYNAFHKEENAEERYFWVGWANCIADIGASELSPLVRNAFHSGEIDPHWMEYDDFERYFEHNHGKEPTRSVWGGEDEQPEISSAIEELSRWYRFSKEAINAEREHQALKNHSIPQKIYIGGKKVGRNSPCPCGSGLKFKKCCL